MILASIAYNKCAAVEVGMFGQPDGLGFIGNGEMDNLTGWIPDSYVLIVIWTMKLNECMK